MNHSYSSSRGVGIMGKHGSDLYRETLRRILKNHSKDGSNKSKLNKEDIMTPSEHARKDLVLGLLGNSQLL